jgi:hypothetical protein
MDLIDLKEDTNPMRINLNFPSNGLFVAICSSVGDKKIPFHKNERV